MFGNCETTSQQMWFIKDLRSYSQSKRDLELVRLGSNIKCNSKYAN